MDNITVNIATQPHRVHSLERSLESLYPQCDKINIYLNNFSEAPHFLTDSKISLYGLGKKDLGASGKFYRLKRTKGYYFACDDDLIYGKDHISYLIHMIELYKRQAVIGVHATIYNRFPIASYYHSGKVFYLEQGNSKDRFVHMLGTGTLGFHTDTLPDLSIDDFPERNMCDPYFAKYCIEHDVAQVAVCHAANWMKLQKAAGDDKAIWKGARDNGSVQTKVINSIKNFRLVQKPKVDRTVFNDATLSEKAVIEIFKLLDTGTILELGSGAVTGVLSQYYDMISVEHDRRYLNKHRSRYIHASLKDEFYDLKEIPKYDLLIIDGPPGHESKRSNFLNHASKFDLSKPIIVDDVHRDDEWNLMVELVSLTNRNANVIETKNKKFAVI